MISTPAIIYVTVCCMHIVQQMIRNRALSIWAAPETDYIIQAMVMAVVVEILYQHHWYISSWLLTLPAIIVSIIIVFYCVLFQCTL